MKILQTAVIKQILTEQSKQKLLDKYNRLIEQLNKEGEQLRFELKRHEKANKHNPSQSKSKFENEIEVRQAKVTVLEFQIEQLHMLPLGSELKEKEVQAIIEVNVGDAWDEKILLQTIIVKDGIIEEIRER